MQVKECLKQNEELRGSLDRLRMEQAVNLNPMSQAGANSPNVGESSPEILSTKVCSKLMIFTLSRCA